GDQTTTVGTLNRELACLTFDSQNVCPDKELSVRKSEQTGCRTGNVGAIHVAFRVIPSLFAHALRTPVGPFDRAERRAISVEAGFRCEPSWTLRGCLRKHRGLRGNVGGGRWAGGAADR